MNKFLVLVAWISLGILVSCEEPQQYTIEDGIYLMRSDDGGVRVDFANCPNPNCYTYVDSFPIYPKRELQFTIKEHDYMMEVDWYTMQTSVKPLETSRLEEKYTYDGMAYLVLVIDKEAINYAPIVNGDPELRFAVAREDWTQEELDQLGKKLTLK